MPGPINQEWERPDPNVEPDPDEVIIPSVPWDDDAPPDSEETNDEDRDGDEDEY